MNFLWTAPEGGDKQPRAMLRMTKKSDFFGHFFVDFCLIVC